MSASARASNWFSTFATAPLAWVILRAAPKASVAAVTWPSSSQSASPHRARPLVSRAEKFCPQRSSSPSASAKPRAKAFLAATGSPCRSRMIPVAVQDRTHDGRKYRMLNVIDEFTHECLAIRVARKLKATDVIDVLSDLFILRGVPGHVRSDNGPEFVAEAVQAWITAVGARTAYIAPGSPLATSGPDP